MATLAVGRCRVWSLLSTVRRVEEGIFFHLRIFQGFTLTAPSLELGVCWPNNDGLLLMAAPKKKTSKSKKKLRNRHKWLKNRSDIETCVVCGNFKLANHLCGNCLEKVKQETIDYRRENNEDEIHWPIPEILKKFRT